MLDNTRPPYADYLTAESLELLSTSSRLSADHRELWCTERSRRVLLLAIVLSQCIEHPDILGPLPSGESARDIVTAAQRTCSPESEPFLMHPPTSGRLAFDGS